MQRRVRALRRARCSFTTGLSTAVEAGVPLYQNLNGPRLERDWSLTLTLTAQF